MGKFDSDSASTTWSTTDELDIVGDYYVYDTTSDTTKKWTASTHYPKIPFGQIMCMDISKIKGVYYIKFGYNGYEKIIPIVPEATLLKHTVRKAKRKSVRKFQKAIMQNW